MEEKDLINIEVANVLLIAIIIIAVAFVGFLSYSFLWFINWILNITY